MRAGFVLQAYLPDAAAMQRRLNDWARERVEAGGAPIMLRLVKGANMEMERFEAAVGGWPQAPFQTKAETDANFTRLLREGMRALGEAMEQEQRAGQPGQGTAEGGDQRGEGRDPLGREQGGSGANSSDAPLAQGPDDQGRARRLLDEIRRRSGEAERPEVERDYLNRLLDRF